MPASKKVSTGPKLTEESAIACDLPLIDGAFVVTYANDDPAYNVHHVFYVPSGVHVLTSNKIELALEAVTISEALRFIATEADTALKDLPTELPKEAEAEGEAEATAPAKKAPAKKATAAKKAPAKSAPAKKAAPAKSAAAK